MKFCPKCDAQYGYEMSYCLEDGTPLQIRSSNDDKNAMRASQNTSVNFADGAEKFGDKPLIIPQNSFPKTNISSEKISEETVILANPSQPTFPAAKNEPRKSKIGFLIGLATAGFLLIAAMIGAVVYFQNRPPKSSAANDLSTNASNSTQVNNSDADADGSASQISSENSANKLNSIPAGKTNSKINASAKKTPESSPSISGETQKIEADNSESVKTAALPPDPVKPTSQLTVSSSVSGGIPNRKSISLIKPSYPPAAKAVRASGRVDVQVTIDESGEVVAAYAVSGHPSLRLSAEQAARASKFSPSAVKGNMTGNIVYNFTPQ